MNKLEALTSLRDKVSRGVDTAHDHAAAFPSESAYGHCTWHDSHRASFAASLDAAKALHEAVLPGWQWAHVPRVKNSRAGELEPCGSIMRIYKPNVKGHTGVDDDPARALLLAIIEALIAQEEPDDKA